MVESAQLPSLDASQILDRLCLQFEDARLIEVPETSAMQSMYRGA